MEVLSPYKQILPSSTPWSGYLLLVFKKIFNLISMHNVGMIHSKLIHNIYIYIGNDLKYILRYAFEVSPSKREKNKVKFFF